MLIYRYSFEIRNSGWIEKEDFKINRNRLHQFSGGKNAAAPTLNLNLSGVYCFAEVGGQTPKQNRTAAHINSVFYYFHSSVLFHFEWWWMCCGLRHCGCPGKDWGQRWLEMLLNGMKQAPTSCTSSLSCPKPGVQQLLEIRKEPLQWFGPLLILPGCSEGYRITPLTLKVVSSPALT